MDKAFSIFLLLIFAGVFLYILPNLAPLLDLAGGSGLPGSSGSSVIWLIDPSGVSEKTVWHSAAAPAVFDIERSLSDPLLYYAATGRGLFVSKDGGANWYEWSDLEKKIDSKTVIYKIAVDRFPGQDSEIFFLSASRNGSGQVYETGDNFFSLRKIFDVEKETITVLESDLDKGLLYLGFSGGRLMSYSLTAEEFVPLRKFDSSVVDVEAVNGSLYAATKFSGLFVSRDGGGNFSPVRNGLALKTGGRLDSIAVEPTGTTLYAASLAGVFRSFNQGSSWQTVDTLIPDNQDVELVELGLHDEIYLGSGDKLYASRNSGRSWQVALDLDDFRQVSAIYFDESGKIIVGTK